MGKKIYNLINESIFISLLNEAKSPEEVLNILTQKYSGIVNGTFIQRLMNLDPTKKYSYTQWALKCLQQGDNLEFPTMERLFGFAQEHKDFQLQTFSSIQEALDGIVLYKGKSEYNVVFEDEEWIVYVPDSYEAERYIVWHLYDGAKWCTAANSDNGRGYFKQYNSGNYRLYIFANKETKKIYQFSPQSGEFNNASNYQVDSPRDILSYDVLEWCDENDLEIDMGSFPGPDDILGEGDYSLKYIDDLYGKYALCDNHGHIYDYGITLYGATEIDDNGRCIFISATEDDVDYQYIYKINSTFDMICAFDDKTVNPYFKVSYAYGMEDDCWICVNLSTGEKIEEISNVTYAEKYDDYILITTYEDDYVYLIFDTKKLRLCNVQDSEYGETTWECSYEVEYNREDGCFYYTDDDNDIDYLYNPETEEVHRIGGNDFDIENDEVMSMAEDIKKRFSTILEKISKNYNAEKLND